MEKIEAFKASDGALFATADECQEHEVSLLWRARVEEFCNSRFCPYPSGAQRSMVGKTVVGWERFKTGV